MNHNPVLKVDQLNLISRRRGRRRRLLTEIGFDLQRGQILAIIGESGSGKSLLCRSLVAEPPPGMHLEGWVKIWSETQAFDLLQLTPARLRQVRRDTIGFLFQATAPALNPVLTCGLQFRHLVGRDQHDDHFLDERLKQVGFADSNQIRRLFPFMLSGGMAQRFGMALALVRQPRLLIADEPFAHLDHDSRCWLRETIHQIRATTAMGVLIVLHDLDDVRSMADQVVVMYAGMMVERGDRQMILTRPEHPYTAMLTEIDYRLRDERRLSCLPVGPPKTVLPETGCPFAPRCQHVAAICRTVLPPLRLTDSGRWIRCHTSH